jgi:hypothetical protein
VEGAAAIFLAQLLDSAAKLLKVGILEWGWQLFPTTCGPILGFLGLL